MHVQRFVNFLNCEKTLFTRRVAEALLVTMLRGLDFAVDPHCLLPCLPVLVHFCNPFLFPGDRAFSTICAGFPDFSHLLQATGALSVSAPADLPLCSPWLVLTVSATSTCGPRFCCSVVRCRLLTLLLGRDCSFHCRNPLLCKREMNGLLGIELLKKTHFLPFKVKTHVYFLVSRFLVPDYIGLPDLANKSTGHPVKSEYLGHTLKNYCCLSKIKI